MKQKQMIETTQQYFAQQKDVLCVYLFGSFASGKIHQESDVDLAVLFTNDVPREEYRQRSLQSVDDLSRILDKEVDVVVLNSADSFLKFQILKAGLRIYERQDRKGRDFEARAMMEYFDFLPVRRRLEEAFVRHINEGV